MKRTLSSVLFASVSLAICPLTAFARLGETLDECTARYGNPTGKVPAMVAGSDNGEAYLFERRFDLGPNKNVLRIRIEFKDGKAWYWRCIGNLKDSDRIDILARNKGADDNVWSEPETILGRTYIKITKPEFSRMACHYSLGRHKVLELMTDTCRREIANHKAKQFDAILQDANWSPPVPVENSVAPEANSDSKPANSSNALDGF